jgi:transcription antitermination factor NusG
MTRIKSSATRSDFEKSLRVASGGRVMATARIHDDPDLLNPTPAHWNIVQTKNLVGASMENWLKNFSEQTGWETYYPLVSELRAVPQRKLSYAQRRSLVVIKRRCACPFIPGKVFVRRRRPQMICRSDITHFPNVLGWVCVGEAPARISHRLVYNLKVREKAGEAGVIPGSTPAEFIFKVGEQVLIDAGPLAFLHATVQAIPHIAIEAIDADTRLRLCIALFGRSTVVDVPVDMVKKI